jgi:mannose-1-phosphate guanylyltransferase (GDP) (EC 2.7.7.22)
VQRYGFFPYLQGFI